MKTVPTYLTRYYQQGDPPFTSLNDLPIQQANAVKRRHCQRYGIGGFYAEDSYLLHRRKVEQWLRSQLLIKGGNPREIVPVYMCLGESPDSQYGIHLDVQKDAKALRIPIEALELSAITFTYPDSMYAFVLDEAGNVVDGRRTDTPKVYLYHELQEAIDTYRTDEHYIEAQVWDRAMLNRYLAQTVEI